MLEGKQILSPGRSRGGGIEGKKGVNEKFYDKECGERDGVVDNNNNEEVARDEDIGKSGLDDSLCGSDDFHG